jgi:hypothetical protein
MAVGSRRQAFPNILSGATPAGYNVAVAYPGPGEKPVSVGFYWEPATAGDDFRLRVLTTRIDPVNGDAYEVGGFFDGDGTLYVDMVFQT